MENEEKIQERERLKIALNALELQGQSWAETAVIIGEAMGGCLDMARSLYVARFGEVVDEDRAPEIVALATAMFEKLIMGMGPRPDYEAPSELVIPGFGGQPGFTIKLDSKRGA